MTTRDERARGLRDTGEMNGKRLAEHLGVAHGTVKRWLHEGMPATRSAQGDQQVWIDPEMARAWLNERFKGRKTVAFDRRSVVYFAQREEGPIKIGFSSDVFRRVAELRKKVRSPVELLACFPGSKPDELKLHARFEPWLIGDEWYVDTLEIRSFIEGLKESAA